MFEALGGKTKAFAVGYAVLQALETSGVVPAGALQSLMDVLQAVTQAGMVFGFRDAITKIKT